MPSQLVKNDAVYFICARNFTYAGTDYKMGEKFDQDIATGQIDLLVRTRRLFAVVDDIEDKPRHWHHHIHLRSVVTKKLGLIHREDSDRLVGESIYNRYKQSGLEFPSADSAETQTPGEPADVGAFLHNKAVLAVLTEQVLQEENDEKPEEPEQTEPEALVNPEPETDEDLASPTDAVTDDDGNTIIGEIEDDKDDEEREVEEEDLYDPAQHSVSDVLEYLTGDVSDEERDRVLASEKIGKKRKGILDV